MMLRVWHALTFIGDGAVLLPCSLLVLAWLLAIRTARRSGWWWLASLLAVAGAVASSKLLYMVTGWRPAGWNFTGLSGHAALSSLFWPSIGPMMIGRPRTALRIVAIVLGGCLALAISAASWVLGDHSLIEVVLGAAWGGLVATTFLAFTWHHSSRVPGVRTWMMVAVLLVIALTIKHQFPSQRVLGWVATQATGRDLIHVRHGLRAPTKPSTTGEKCPHGGSSAADGERCRDRRNGARL